MSTAIDDQVFLYTTNIYLVNFVIEMEKHKSELSKLQEKGAAGKPKLPMVCL